MKQLINTIRTNQHFSSRSLFSGLLLLFTLIGSPAKAQTWNTNVIGTMPGVNALSITLADGRNDGVNRIYATTGTGIYEWTYNGATWTSSTVVNGISPTLISLTAGIGRNDGITRLYFVEWLSGGTIYEASWNGSSWNINSIGNAPGGTSSTGIAVGPGRNDGVNRVFSMGSYGVYEFSWNGSSWSQLTVANNWCETNGFVGDARNDGTDRLVFNASCNWEASWNGTNYSIVGLSACSSSQSADAVEIGQGRNDGVNRVYANTELAGRIEYTWNGSSYTATTVRANGHRGDIHLAQLHSDQLTRVYMTNASHGIVPPGDLLEYTWNNSTSQWDSTNTVLSAVSGATSFLQAGDGRNDNIIRLYAPRFATGEILEITSSSPNNLCSGMSATSTTTGANCTAANGSATVAGTGGTAPYSYQWDAAAGNQTSANATGLAAGTYNCTVSDAAGCSYVAGVTIASLPSTITNTMNISDASCGSSNGSATANASNGAAPYSYQWDAAAGNQTGPVASGLSAGAYQVTITDNNGCTFTDIATISNIGAPTLSISQTDVQCFGDLTGSATVTATGGTPSYTYSWNDPNSSTSASVSGLGAGTYVVTVIDQSGCQALSSVTITEPMQLVSTINTTLTSTAALDLTVTGGTPPYTYAWSNGPTTEDQSGLPNGNYLVTVTDFNGCILQDSVSITTLAVPEIETMRFNIYPNPANHALHFAFENTSDYQVEIYTLGGDLVKSTAGSWDNHLQMDVSELPAGMYMAKVSDANKIGFKRFSIIK